MLPSFSRPTLPRLVAALLFLIRWDPAAFAQEEERTPVGPGVVHRSLTLSEGPWAIHVLEIDLTDPFLQIETVKARDRLRGLERTSQMAGRRDWERHRVVGAINGDFYTANGLPVGLQVARGVLVHEPARRSFFGIQAGGRPLLARVTLEAGVQWHDRTVALKGVNKERRANDLILYNFYYGPSTGTSASGTEVTLRPIDAVWVNRPVRFVTVAIDSVRGDGLLSDTTWVLSGQGISADLLRRQVRPGDTVEVELRLPPLAQAIKDAVGGLPRIVRDGAVSVETEIDGGANFARVRHPRTAVGFSADSTRMWWVTVDGRQPGYSVGMTLFELAELLIDLGADQAINLDGGGSTTMVVRGRVVNRPSDAQGERAVSNALLVISRAPTEALAYLRISPRRVELLAGESKPLSVAGFDRYHNPLDLSAETLSWEVDPRIGILTTDGRLTAAATNDSGFVRVRAGALVDSALVVVHTLARLVIEPSLVVLGPGEQQALQAYGVDADGDRFPVAPGLVDWSVSGEVGTVSPAGVFTAADSGQGWIEARIDVLTSRAEVRVGVESNVQPDPR